MFSNGIHSLRISNEDCVFMVSEGRQARVRRRKGPFDDARETHGICLLHRDQIREHWQASTRYTGTSSFVRAATTFTLLRWSGLLNSQKTNGRKPRSVLSPPAFPAGSRGRDFRDLRNTPMRQLGLSRSDTASTM